MEHVGTWPESKTNVNLRPEIYPQIWNKNRLLDFVQDGEKLRLTRQCLFAILVSRFSTRVPCFVFRSQSVAQPILILGFSDTVAMISFEMVLLSSLELCKSDRSVERHQVQNVTVTVGYHILIILRNVN